MTQKPPTVGQNGLFLAMNEYIYIECENDSAFSEAIKYLEDNAIPLVGAVHDFTCPQTGKNYMFFPIRKL